eukprot:5689024-Pyramimonas_sp.AAC.1
MRVARASPKASLAPLSPHESLQTLPLKEESRLRQRPLVGPSRAEPPGLPAEAAEKPRGTSLA